MSTGETPIVINWSMHSFVMSPDSHIDALSFRVAQELNTDSVVRTLVRLIQ